MTKRILLCSPKFFTVDYSINPWMNASIPVSAKKAQIEWQNLKSLYESLGCEVLTLSEVDGLPDMVFTANAGLILDSQRVIVSSFKNPERQGEEPEFTKWFKDHGWETFQLDVPFEGVAEAFPVGEQMLVGHGFRASSQVPELIEEITGREVVSVKLVDPSFYHLDMTTAIPRQDLLIFYPGAFDEESATKIRGLMSDVIEVTREDACAFGCNLISLNDTDIIMNTGTKYLADQLKERGLTVHELEMAEFKKAGGGVRCLTFDLTPTIYPVKDLCSTKSQDYQGVYREDHLGAI